MEQLDLLLGDDPEQTPRCCPQCRPRVGHPHRSVSMEDATDRLRRDGVNTPSWEALAFGWGPPVGRQERLRERNPTELLHGWQKEVSSKVHKNHREKVVWPFQTAGMREHRSGLKVDPRNSAVHVIPSVSGDTCGL